MTERPIGGRGTRRRLSRSAEFERVYRQGRSKGNRFAVVYAFPRQDDGGDAPRLGLSVSRRVGGSIERSRVKRVIREAFWAQGGDAVDPANDYVVVARPALRELDEREGMEAVRAVLGDLLSGLAGAKGSRAAPQA